MASFHVSTTFLKNLTSLFPNRVLNVKSGGAFLSRPRQGVTAFCIYIDALRNPWFIVAAVAFSASNRPEAVPCVFKQALQDLKNGSYDKSKELMLAKKLREALFKSGFISGYPKVTVGIFEVLSSITDYVNAVNYT